MATKRLYEGMFLVDSTLAAADWEGTLAVIENILKRAEAEVVVIRKWGERKLAYDIDHKSRGTYILSYFKVDPRRVTGIEKDVQLSEKVMRVLILTTEDRPAEMVEQDIAGLPKPEVPEVAPEARPPARQPGLAGAGLVGEEGPGEESGGAGSADEENTER
jgi:small subunit ribosomal protein S6